jgi:hypothetical protein
MMAGVEMVHLPYRGQRKTASASIASKFPIARLEA